MESWQAVVIIFFVLLPLVLMLDFWGDERLTARGRPISRQWQRQIPTDDLHGGEGGPLIDAADREGGPPIDAAGREAGPPIDAEQAASGH